MIGLNHFIQDLLQISLFFPAGPGYKFGGQGVEHIGLLQLAVVQHDPEGPPGGAEQGGVPPGNVHEPLPQPPAFAYGTEGHGVSHHRHQALGTGDGRVQQLGVGQEPEVRLRVFIVQDTCFSGPHRG